MSDKPKILFEQQIGISKTTIEDEPDAVEMWKGQIEDIIDALSNKDRDRLQYLLRIDSKRLNELMILAEKARANPENTKILAISLWVGRQSNWNGYMTVLKKLVSGAKEKITDLSKEAGRGAETCYESSILSKRMTEAFNINATIETIEQDRSLSHRYLKTTSGKIIDNFWGWHRFGYFENNDDYKKNMKPDLSHRCYKT
jgi:hypothetical protein